ncbi:hypothetical protein BJ165DRAFT_1355617, partial [Panaeolus papilionaceus]
PSFLTGEMETTLLNASAQSANLRALLEDESEIKPLVLEMVEKIDAIEKEDIWGYRLASIPDPSSPSYTSSHGAKPVQLSDPTQELWRQYVDQHLPTAINAGEPVLSYRQIAVQGVCYSTTDHIFRNSAVFFMDTILSNTVSSMADYDTLKAAFIDLIFQPQGGNPQHFYMVIRELVPVNEPHLDPFRPYSFSGGFLCRKNKYIPKIIQIDQLKSHAALTPMSLGKLGEVYHILCVDRVSAFAHMEENCV